MNRLNAAAALLPITLNSELLILSEEQRSNIEEIRLRSGQAMTALISGREIPIAQEHIITSDELESVLECATGASVHSVETSIANGYVNVSGGIRLGICGTAIMRGGNVSGIRNLSSLSIRIPCERYGCAEAELNTMLADGVTDILIISPPGAGKTTCLREFIRVISNMGYRVSVADERGEIAAVCNGSAQFDVGIHTDIISDAPKASAAMILIRAMNPQVLAMDEISTKEDVQAIFEAAGCGVKLIATAHAGSFEDLYTRQIYRQLIDSGVFKYCLMINNDKGHREYCVKKL